MNNQNNNDDIIISRNEDFTVTFDATAFFMAMLLLAYGEHDKQRISYFLNIIQAQDVQLAEIAKNDNIVFTPHLAAFLQKRIEDNRSALKLKSIFGFLKSSSVEKEASALAFAEAAQFTSLARLSDSPAFQRILTDRHQLIKDMFSELQSLIERGQNIVITPQKLQEVLKWVSNRNLLS